MLAAFGPERGPRRFGASGHGGHGGGKYLRNLTGKWGRDVTGGRPGTVISAASAQNRAEINPAARPKGRGRGQELCKAARAAAMSGPRIATPEVSRRLSSPISAA